MTVLPLLAVGLLMKFVAVLFVLVCLVLILVVLMQKGRGGGLSGAFAGGMASGLLGSKTGDFLTWVTIVLVTIFLFLAVLMARYYRPPVRFGRTEPATSRQPQPQRPTTAGQTATPQTPASEQPAAPSATPSSDATQPAAPAAQPSAPAAQPPAPQPGTSDTGAQPTPGADAGKSGG